MRQGRRHPAFLLTPSPKPAEATTGVSAHSAPRTGIDNSLCPAIIRTSDYGGLNFLSINFNRDLEVHRWPTLA